MHILKHVLGGCPAGRLPVTAALRPEVLQWGMSPGCSAIQGFGEHCSPSVNASGGPHWPQMSRQFVLACPTCAQCKPVNRPPDGLLQLLPILSSPWSHIGLDFVSGLPPLKDNTVILSSHLPKLTSTQETAQLMVDHVFHLHGLPVDVVSDRGP